MYDKQKKKAAAKVLLIETFLLHSLNGKETFFSILFENVFFSNVKPDFYSFNVQILSKDMDEVISSSDFERTVVNFDNNFSKHLLRLLEKLNSFSKTDFQHQMLNIVRRLDHNGFYGKQLEKMAATAAGTLSIYTWTELVWKEFFNTRSCFEIMLKLQILPPNPHLPLTYYLYLAKRNLEFIENILSPCKK